MNRRGFSLVEMMITLVIIAILSAIAVPHFREMRLKANETWALTYVRSWIAAQENYRLKFQTYAASDEELIRKGFVAAPDSGSSNPRICGYSFEIRGGTDIGEQGKWRWEGWADPVVPGATGRSFFYVTAEDGGIIHTSTTGRASKASPPLNYQD